MPDRCYWVRDDDGDEVLIPMCHGSAIFGPASCTCRVPESRIEVAERGRSTAEAHVMKLREARDRRLDEQKVNWRVHKRLRQRIEQLETQLAELSSHPH